ncbi:hypothetical protein EXIGLDRAFT_769616, partial [Exidia glandulosa HHB12029]
WSTNVDNLSLHVTWGPDTSLEFTFTGQGVEMYGTTSPSGAVAHAAVDSRPEVVVNFFATDGATHNNVLLLNQTGLDPGQHTLAVKYNSASFGKAGNRKFMWIDFFQISSPPPSASTSTTPSSTPTQLPGVIPTTITSPGSGTASPSVIVSYITQSPAPSSSQDSSSSGSSSHTRLAVVVPVALVAILALLSCAFLAFWCFRKRRRSRRRGTFTRVPGTVSTSSVGDVDPYIAPPSPSPGGQTEIGLRERDTTRGTRGSRTDTSGSEDEWRPPTTRWRNDDPLPEYTPRASTADVSAGGDASKILM